MAEWEEMLQAILGDPETMQRIMALSQSLGGNAAQSAPPEKTGAEQTPELPAMLAQLDPKLLQMGSALLQGENNGKEQALLRALTPYVKDSRRKDLEQALQLVRMTHLIRLALGISEKGGGQDV